MNALVIDLYIFYVNVYLIRFLKSLHTKLMSSFMKDNLSIDEDSLEERGV